MTKYQEDEVGWAMEQIAFMRRGAVNSLDLENIAEELEDMMSLKRDAVASQVKRLLLHLLKWKYQPEKRTVSWKVSINNSREDILDKTTGESGSRVLYNELPKNIEKEYPRAARQAALETELPRTTFPDRCEWVLEQLLDEDFYPRSLEEECDNPPSIKDALAAFEKNKGEKS